MTTIDHDWVPCPLCGEETEQSVVNSMSVFGASDLDTRPPEMERSLLSLLLAICPGCGYVWGPDDAPDPPRRIRELVRGIRYQAVRANPDLPEMARAYRCRALVDLSAGDYAAAGWSCLRAAWICDDEAGYQQAAICRHQAAENWRVARVSRQPIASGDGADEAVLCDVLRRAGDFDGALAECDRGLIGPAEGVIRAVLEFERELIAAQDRDAHSVGELTVDQ